MLTDPPRPAPVRRRPAMRALWVPVGVAAALHAALLTASDLGVGASQAQPVPATMQVRALPAQVDALAVLGGSPAPSDAAARPALAVIETPRPARSRGPRIATSPVLPPVADESLQAPSPRLSSDNAPDADVSPISPIQVAAISADADLVKNIAVSGAAETSVPVYRTVMPPPSTLRYDLRKGFIPGSGELVWKPSADRYEARLEGSVAGVNLLTQTSVGALDANGIAPSRYTDARSRRGTNAANFQRDKGKITYSGPQVEYPLIPGTQDRVSWMIQIGAILNADPKLAVPGGKISMFVSGANGDADVWVFQFVGAENLRTDAGVLRTVKFTREPRKAYDRSVEVWLAPTRNHLPIRARFTANAGGDAFELLLRDIHSP